MKGQIALAVAAAVAGMSSWSSASVIGVNFQGRSAATTTVLGTSDIAGFVPQGNWNNTLGSLPSQGTETSGALMDDSGTATPVTLTATYSDSWHNATGSTTPDQTLFNGILKASANGAGNNTATLTWNNVPAGVYNLIFETAENDGAATGTFTVGATSQQIREPNGNNLTGAITYATHPGDTTQESNYVQFTNISPVAGTITIGIVHNADSDGFGIAGAQLQSVPEPASLALIGLTAVGMFARRRRN